MTVVINIKTDESVKKQAQKIASEMGLSLSAILKAYLMQFIRTKRLNIDLYDIPLQKELEWKEDENMSLKKEKHYTK